MIWPTPKPAVKAAVDILATAFGSYADVSTGVPPRRPVRFVRVSRAGGSQEHVATDRARLLVECFGVDVATTENMCNTARAALRNAAGTTVADDIFIRSWGNEEGPTDFPHPDILDMCRWQFTGDLDVKSN